jgi:hypothetical protein
MEEIASGFLENHPHVCWVLFLLLIFPAVHSYMLHARVMKVFGMRKWDWLFLQPPRRGGKPPRKSGPVSRTRSRPPLPPEEQLNADEDTKP